MGNHTPLEEQSHALYRFFGSGGTLLYIGITNSIPVRLKKHNADKPWWTGVSNITVEHFPNRPAVLEAERRAIIAEKPLYNDKHNRAGRWVNQASDEPDVEDRTSDLAEILGDELVASELAYYDQSDTSRDEGLWAIATSHLSSHVEELANLRSSVFDLFKTLPGGLVQHLQETAEWHHVKLDDAEMLPGFLHTASVWFAQQYLQTLLPAERGEWLRCAWQVARTEDDAALRASRLARSFKSTGKFPDPLCRAPGQHGAVCSEVRVHSFHIVNCPECAPNSCSRHSYWCPRHLREASSSASKGLNIVDVQLRDMTEVGA